MDWVLDLLVAAQEIDPVDVKRPLSSPTAHSRPVAPAPAVAAPTAAPEEEGEREQITEEAFNAMRWASKVDMDANVSALVRSLPAQIVKEQLLACRARDATAVAAAKPPEY